MGINRKIQTLDEFTIQQMRDFPNATGELAGLLRDIGLAAKRVHVEVNKAGLVDILGDTGTRHVQGEEVKKLDDVFLYTLDDLGEIVEAGLESRQAAVVEAESIIDTRVDNFLHWISARDVVPTIRALRDAADRMRRHELERAVKLLAKGEDPQRVLEALSHGLTNKLLHGPTHALNEGDGDPSEIAGLISRMYHLHPGE